MLFGQRLQHLLVALPATNFLPAPPIKSCFIAIDAGHNSPVFELITANTVDALPRVRRETRI